MAEAKKDNKRCNYKEQFQLTDKYGSQIARGWQVRELTSSGKAVSRGNRFFPLIDWRGAGVVVCQVYLTVWTNWLLRSLLTLILWFQAWGRGQEVWWVSIFKEFDCEKEEKYRLVVRGEDMIEWFFVFRVDFLMRAEKKLVDEEEI